jgi:DNA-binding transcriptional ArsR family regulator
VRTLLEASSTTVSDLARATGLSLGLCSLYLKNLQARGVCRAERNGRFVRYALSPDPLVPQAAPLLAAIIQALRDGDDDCAVFRALTAYTHPTRIRIVAALGSAGPRAPLDLQTRVQCSQSALSRHLAKLVARAVVRATPDGIELNDPPTKLARDLLALALHSATR